MVILVAGCWFVTGCGRLPEGEMIAEVSEPSFEEGKRLLRQGKQQAALAAFTRVIDARRDGAPESHLEVGLLYQLEIKDPVSAIYHFRRHLELKPNSPQADLVRQRIDAATRDFARTLPAQPMENQILRNDLLDVVEQLKRENTRLKDEVALLRNHAAQAGGATRPAVADLGGGASGPPPRQAAVASSPFSSVPLNDAPVVARPTRPEAAPPAITGGKKHTVVKGDTLYNLARRYYSNPSRAKDIYAANRNVMRSDSDLQIGMELVIPD